MIVKNIRLAMVNSKEERGKATAQKLQPIEVDN